LTVMGGACTAQPVKMAVAAMADATQIGR